MFKKLFITSILLITLTGMLFSSADLFLKKKIQIEDALRNNLHLDQDYYKIWVGNRSDSDPNSKYRIEDKSSTKDQKKYIPGLPTAPSSKKDESNYQSYSHSYKVEIFLDETYNTLPLQNSIDKLIKTDIWPALNHCDACITFEILKFYKPGGVHSSITTGQDDEKLRAAEKTAAEARALAQELRNQILALEEAEAQREKAAAEKEAKRLEEEAAREQAILENKFIEYEARIKELEAASDSVEAKEKALAEEEAARNQQKLEDTFIEYEAKIRELTDANIALDETSQLNEYDKNNAEEALKEKEIEHLGEQLEELKKSKSLETALDAQKTLNEKLDKEVATLIAKLDKRIEKQEATLDAMLDKALNPITGCTEENAKNYNKKANIACEGCCRYEKESGQYVEGCMQKDATNYNPAATQPCQNCCESGMPETDEEDGGGWMMWTLFGLVLVLIILSVFTMMGNKKKVVYLKPKNNKNAKKEDNKTEDSANTPQPVMPPTTASVDEGVLQSEIQTQRQSAVAMSAGQKEGATQILKDWLDESKNDDENNSEG